jgi:DNA (cytosine-5)-methyltransferase 1
VAGKRAGFEDLRGQLIYEVIRILKAKQPKYFILENVIGLLSHNQGNTIEIILEGLCDAGYAIDFEILNAKYFGVPQSRERVFIIGKRLDLLADCDII